VRELAFEIHGLSVRIQTDSPTFAEYVYDNLSLFSTQLRQEPDMDVVFDSQTDPLRELSRRRATRIAQGLWIGEDSVLADRRGLQIHAHMSPGGPLTITARYSAPKPRRGLASSLVGLVRKKGGRSPREISHYVAREIVHLPIFMLLAKKRSLAVLHAASVAKEDRALVFTGLNSCGKSSLAAYLSLSKGWFQMNDNFTITDGSRILAYPESSRISKDMAHQLGLEESGAETYGKLHVSLPRISIPVSANPEIIFILSLGEKASVSRIEPDEFLNHMAAIDDYLAEFPEYSYLRFLGQFDEYIETRRRRLSQIARKTRQFILVQSNDKDLDATYRLIEDTLNEEG